MLDASQNDAESEPELDEFVNNNQYFSWINLYYEEDPGASECRFYEDYWWNAFKSSSE